MKQKINLAHHSVFHLIILLTFLLISCKDDSYISEPPPDEVDLYTEFERITDSLIIQEELPGLVVGVWAPNKNIAWVKAKGKADIYANKVMKNTDLFRIGSITKTFVVTVLLQLVDEGRLKLDDKLNVFFPDFPNGNNIIVRQLCNMTSGIYNYTETDEFFTALTGEEYKVFKPEELVDMAKNKTPYFPPGHDYYYSNTNLILVGLIIEKVTNSKLETEAKNRILDPLNLKNTFFPSDRFMPGEYAHGYEATFSTQINTVDVSEMFDPSWHGQQVQ